MEEFSKSVARDAFLSGNKFFQAKNYLSAENCYQRSLEYLPENSSTLDNLISVLLIQEKFIDAYSYILKRLRINPFSASTWHNKGLIHLNEQNFVKALDCLETALQLDPSFGVDAFNLGLSELEKSDAQAKLRHEAIQSGDAFFMQNRFVDALGSYSHSSSLGDHSRTTQLKILSCHLNLKRLEPAEKLAKELLQAECIEPQLIFLAAIFYFQLGRHEECKRYLDSYVTNGPPNYEVTLMLGILEGEAKNFEVAEDIFSDLIRSEPGDYRALMHLGVSHHRRGSYKDAQQYLVKAYELNQSTPALLMNIALVFDDLDEVDEAKRYAELAVQGDADNPLIRTNLAQILLKNGEYERGWAEYDWRVKDPAKSNRYVRKNIPLWSQFDVLSEGAPLLVSREQGFGDFFQFCRYIKMFEGREIFVEVPSGCEQLIKSLGSNVVPVKDSASAGRVIAHVPLLSLPLFFVSNSESTIPYASGYLKAAKCFNPGSQRRPSYRVGLVWRGGKGSKWQLNRSIELVNFQKILELDIEFHVLQIDVTSEERIFLSQFSNVHLDSIASKTFDETAQRIEGMDLVLTVDTAVAHLAGALGKPTWILLPRVADYRWLRNREDSPWYESVRLFRNGDYLDTSALLQSVSDELRNVANE